MPKTSSIRPIPACDGRTDRHTDDGSKYRVSIASRGKNKVPWLSRGVGCVMMRLSVLIEHRLVTDRQTDIHTNRQTKRRTDGRTIVSR